MVLKDQVLKLVKTNHKDYAYIDYIFILFSLIYLNGDKEEKILAYEDRYAETLHYIT